MVLVQMVTPDRVGGATLPVEVMPPCTSQRLVAAAANKFKAVTKQSRVYYGATCVEITGEASPEELAGTFVVVSGKAGWKGRPRPAPAHADDTAQPKEQELGAVAEVSSEQDVVSARDSMLEAARTNRSTGVVLFWRDEQDNGYLSNWSRSQMEIEGVQYGCVEQWIMATKARLCGNETVCRQIMQTSSPRAQKALGRSLDSKTVQKCWKMQHRWETQLAGATAKFSQSEALALRLLRTGQKPIAEASPSDRIYGIGIAPSDPLAQDPANWRGTNLLGRVLMQVREELRRHVLAQHGEEPPTAMAAAAPDWSIGEDSSDPDGE
eukprot:NODE_10344_length_1358_cov_16.212023.p1 GENE.NODE_10344_length_1358_cov_16.212023~~NODE_10344_length_1358_cov_16.212023.p1  ORF type:complete len:323 (-),score=84.41 NODE_10344_length_1358_cov_16.212023:313-1281(-)